MLWNLFFTDRFLTKDVDAKIRYFNEYTVKPYYRIAPYLVGITCADIYMKTKDCVSNMKENWWKVWENCIMIFTAQTEPNEAPHQMINGIEFFISKIALCPKFVAGATSDFCEFIFLLWWNRSIEQNYQFDMIDYF